jgi:hypothetical protein
MTRFTRSRTARRTVALVAVMAAVLSIESNAFATTAPTPVLWSFSAGKTFSGNAVGAFLAARDRFCPPGKPIASSLTLAKALASARAIVVAMAGAAAVNAFERSSTAASAVQSRAAAVGMFADRKPVPALLALLRVHESRSPRRATFFGSGCSARDRSTS